MNTKYSDFRYLLLVTFTVLALGFLNLAWAAPPEIDSVTPDMGSNLVPTQITINGSGFQPTPKVALYGGEASITGSYATPQHAFDVHVEGTYAYVAATYAGLQVIDISDPKNPTIGGTCYIPGYGSAFGVYVAGTYAYVAGGMAGFQVLDVSDPANPRIVGGCVTPGGSHPMGAYAVYVTGTYAYVVDYDSGLQVIDISDPANPRIVGAYDPPGVTEDVYVAGTYAYVADSLSGLRVIDISDPANPGIVGSCGMSGSAYGVYVTGTYAYVAGGGSGLQVVDISDPTNPSIVGACDTPGFAWGVSIIGTYAYVADYRSGLQVIDISDPENPNIVGACDTPGFAYDVYVTGTYAYVADGGSGLQVIEKFSLLTDIQYMDSSTIIATVPAGYRPGTYDLHVTNPDGGYAVLRNAFTSPNTEVGGVPVDAGTGITVTFEGVTEAGNTIATITDQGPLPPTGFTLAETYYEITSTATYSGTMEICVNYDESNLPPSVLEDNLILQQYDDITDTWVDITTSRDTVNNLICGEADHLSFFGVMYQVEEVEVTMELLEGWSMISLPIIPDDASVAALFPGAVVVYGYEKDSGYVRQQTLKTGKGYWILLNEEKSYTLTGQPIPSYTISVNEDGWHMIGGCTEASKASVDTGSGSIGVIYKYTQGLGYQRVLESEPLEPCKGYWILINNAADEAAISVETVD